MSSKDYYPEKEIPDLSGKVIFITGGNSGIGAESVRQLSAHNPSCVYLCARKISAGDACAAAIKEAHPNAKIHVLPLDLSSFESIRQCAQAFNEQSSRLDILMLNAGGAGFVPGLTKEGYEMHFGVNYVGHAFLTQLLLPKMIQTKREDPHADLRIHITSSKSGVDFAPSRGLALNYMREASPGSGATQRYGHSKLATLLFMQKLSQQYPDILIMASHPGMVKTETWGKVEGSKTLTLVKPFRNMFTITTEEGAKNQLWCVTAMKGPRGVQTGKFYIPHAKEFDLKSQKHAGNHLEADQLWHWTNDEFKKHDAPGWPKMEAVERG